MGRGVLDTPHARGTTISCSVAVHLRFARNDVEGPQRTEYPTYAGYEASLAPRKVRQTWQRDRGFTDGSHAHVKGRSRVQIDND